MRKYALAVLTAMFAINQLDRHVLSITLESIGQEFALSDTQLGVLSGLVFALVYALFGFPIAKLAAKGNRRNIIAVSMGIWSALTIAMAAAQNFWHLAVARLGVGMGEAGAVSPAHSIISDYYPPDRRTSAMAIFMAGANFGVLLAFLIGGIAGQVLGWRWAFIIAGVPGLILALILRFTVQEPRRSSEVAETSVSGSLFVATWKVIWNDKGLYHAMCAIALTGILTFGALTWTAAFIIRAHGLNQAQTGIFLALTIGIVGGIGTWVSGQIADHLGARNPRWRIGVVVCSILIAKPFALAFLLLDNLYAALGCFFVTALMGASFWAPTFAYVHSRVDAHMRPMATAVFLFAFNLVGVGIGPLLVGFMSDHVFYAAAERSLGYAIAVTQMIGVWGAYHYWLVTRHMPAHNTPE